MEDLARKKLIQKYYAKRARDYDQQKMRTWKSREGFGTEIISGITDTLAGLENKLVLEVGVGSGRTGFPLLEKVKPWFVGLDLSKEMLRFAKLKMSHYKQNFDLILGDAEHLPFTNGVFDAIVCISVMHYFEFPERSLTEFSRTLKEKGFFVYGDLTMHELDSRSFLDTLEKTLSKAHARYCKSSEMEKLLKNHRFHVSKVKVFPYRKSYLALMEDKGRYFDVKFEALKECIREAAMDNRRLYSVDSDGLTLFYMLITALKENKH
jgi:ubiquinone/menaquinone biosynthesis C-methylase UbiE